MKGVGGRNGLGYSRPRAGVENQSCRRWFWRAAEKSGRDSGRRGSQCRVLSQLESQWAQGLRPMGEVIECTQSAHSGWRNRALYSLLSWGWCQDIKVPIPSTWVLPRVQKKECFSQWLVNNHSLLEAWVRAGREAAERLKQIVAASATHSNFVTWPYLFLSYFFTLLYILFAPGLVFAHGHLTLADTLRVAKDGNISNSVSKRKIYQEDLGIVGNRETSQKQLVLSTKTWQGCLSDSQTCLFWWGVSLFYHKIAFLRRKWIIQTSFHNFILYKFYSQE